MKRRKKFYVIVVGERCWNVFRGGVFDAWANQSSERLLQETSSSSSLSSSMKLALKHFLQLNIFLFHCFSISMHMLLWALRFHETPEEFYVFISLRRIQNKIYLIAFAETKSAES